MPVHPSRASRQRPGHARRRSPAPRIVVVGDAPEVPALAAGLDHDAVAVVGLMTPGSVRMLKAQGIEVLADSLDDCPPRLLRGVDQFVVAGTTDATTVDLVTHLLRAAHSEATLRPLVDEAALVGALDRHGRISALHRPALIAGAVLSEYPPTLPDRVCPPPIIVGGGVLARELVAHIVGGWGQAGEPMVVHCVGACSDWASTAAAEVGSRGAITWTELPLAAAAVLQHLDTLLAQWQAPPVRHAQSAGPTILVALEEPEVGVPLALVLARYLPHARVVALSPDADPWDALHSDADGDVEIVSTTEILAAAVAQPEPTDAPLTKQLLTEAAVSQGQSLLGNVRLEGKHVAPLSDQPDGVRFRMAAVAGAINEILGGGGVVLSSGNVREAERIVLTPGELRRMGERILGLLGLPNTDDTRLMSLELASRLPVVAARAGFTPRRGDQKPSLLSAETLELLAPLVHHAYQQVGQATNNVTGSPWLYETWEGLDDYVKASNRAVLTGSAVGFAMEGLDWAASDDPQVMEFRDGRLERLAELEHRRWVDHQRRNGRPEHTYVVPWDGLDDATKEYDRVIVRALPRLLAHAGIQLVEQNPVSPPAG